MRAVVWRGGRIQFEGDHPKPVPKSGEALIRVLMAGICNTDLEITKGYLNFSGIPGHEFVGEVIFGSNPKLIGQRVVGEINCACGKCSYCKAGLNTHCPSRTVLGIVGRDGAFAEFLTLPEENLHIVPKNVTNQEAVFCEPLAAGWEILEQIEISSKDEVMIMGDGKLGLLIAQVIKTTNCKLLAVGKHPENLGILQALDIETKLLDQLDEQQFDIVIDATGSPSGLEKAIEHTRPRGKVILKSTVAEKPRINLAPIVINELSIIGSRCGPFAPALKSLADKKVKVNPLISATYTLDQAEEALEKATRPGVLKVLFDMNPVNS